MIVIINILDDRLQPGSGNFKLIRQHIKRAILRTLLVPALAINKSNIKIRQFNDNWKVVRRDNGNDVNWDDGDDD